VHFPLVVCFFSSEVSISVLQTAFTGYLGRHPSRVSEEILFDRAGLVAGYFISRTLFPSFSRSFPWFANSILRERRAISAPLSLPLLFVPQGGFFKTNLDCLGLSLFFPHSDLPLSFLLSVVDYQLGFPAKHPECSQGKPSCPHWTFPSSFSVLAGSRFKRPVRKTKSNSPLSR